VAPGAGPGTTPRVQLPVVFGGAVLDELEPGMFGQCFPPAAPGAPYPAEPVEPVLEPVDAELLLAVVLAAGVVVVLVEVDAAWAIVAPPIAPAAPSTARALIMRARIIGCSFALLVASSQRSGAKATVTPA
jgi:hypothetical protein